MATYELEGPKWAVSTITWSFADPARPNSGAFSAQILDLYQAVIRRAMARWDDLVSLTFKEVADTAADVSIRVG